jgi:N-acetyltransferase
LFSEVEFDLESVKVVPLSVSHRDSLVQAASDGQLWELWFTSVPCEKTIDSYINFALIEKQNGSSFPFVVIDKSSNKVIGSTRYCNADTKNNRLEIGYTWYSKSYQKSSVNTECKLALLEYAFEYINVIAVEFRTHWHNHSSKIAITRLGAKQDGVLRNHQQTSDGCYRDTVVFSIINNEWAVVKKNLMHKLK